MIKHIVMMKMQDAEEVILQDRLKKLKEMLSDLSDGIPSLVNMQVGLNISTRPTAYDIVLVSDFINEEGLNSYRNHPKHLTVIAYIKDVVADAKVVDYQYE